MDSVTEIVALLRKQADLEIAIMNGHRSAVATEQELEATRRRLRTSAGTDRVAKMRLSEHPFEGFR